MPIVNKSIFESQKILLPPLEEQVKIAEVLTAWDDALETLGKLIAAKLELKRGLMQALLTGKKRFQEFGTREWKKTVLGKIVEFNYGKSQRDLSNQPGEFPIYGTSGILGFSSQFVFSGESILVGRKGTIDKPIRIRGSFWIVDTAYFLTGFQKSNIDWISHFLNFIDLKSFNEASGVPSLNRQTLGNIPMNLPPLEEQIRITDVLTTLDMELERLRGQLERIKMQKKGLMQHLLTGKTRVKI